MAWSKGRGWFGFRSAVPGIALLLMITFVGLGNASAATTHYISKSVGSDSNNGTSKSTPWAHIPGMAGATSNAASYTPVAGDQFILYGGDTWGSADLGGVNLTYSGSSGSPIYIGVDQTWYTGSSWTRPIWNCQTTNCGDNSATFSNVVWLAGNYLTLDNIEITGYQCDDGGSIVATYGSNVIVENMYIHGWSRTGTCGQPGTNNPFAITMAWSNFTNEGQGNEDLNNVIDGSDSPNLDFMGGILHGNIVRGNVVRYVYDGMNGLFSIIDGNLVEYNYVSLSGDHCNMIYPQNTFPAGALGANTIQISNNVVRHAGCSGGTTIFVLSNCQSGCNNTAKTAYLFNNVLYDNEVNSDKGFSIGGPGSNGTFYYYNNTVVTLSGYCMQNGSAGTGTAYYSNLHCITSSSGPCNFVNGTCTSGGGNLLQSAAQASVNISTHFDHYTASGTYAYTPVASTNSTVGAGTNYTSTGSFTCSTFPAMCSDSTYTTYNTTNHTAVSRTANSRPSSGAWDIGGYQYNNGGNAPPNPPTGLTIVVH